jgi:hypothetical protein
MNVLVGSLPVTHALLCYGLLTPRKRPCIEYRVEYKLYLLEGSLREVESGGLLRATCSKFVVRSVDSRAIPEGHYDLHSKDGFTHHLQHFNGNWRFIETIKASAHI